MPEIAAVGRLREAMSAAGGATVPVHRGDLGDVLSRLWLVEQRLAYVATHGGGFEQFVARGEKDDVVLRSLPSAEGPP